MLAQVAQVAPTSATVLVLGETGTGKELVARAIHDRSPRRARTLVKVNCAALPPTLVESELFGHEKGAFTGATRRRLGRFELADGGTLFLDEIGELAPGPAGEAARASCRTASSSASGGTHTRKVDVRIVAATNRDLARAIGEGRFREDLYYRLNVFPIALPPLRERREDVPLLVWRFVDAPAGRRSARRSSRCRSGAMDALMDYALARQRARAGERDRACAHPVSRIDAASWRSRWPPRHGPRADRLDEIEREHILRVLERCGWRIEGRETPPRSWGSSRARSARACTSSASGGRRARPASPPTGLSTATPASKAGPRSRPAGERSSH